MQIYEVEHIFDVKRFKNRWPGETILRLGKKPLTLDEYMHQYGVGVEGRIKNLEEGKFERTNPRREDFAYRERLGFVEYFIGRKVVTGTGGQPLIDVGEIDVANISP
jgi:hypothetical protein